MRCRAATRAPTPAPRPAAAASPAWPCGATPRSRTARPGCPEPRALHKLSTPPSRTDRCSMTSTRNVTAEGIMQLVHHRGIGKSLLIGLLGAIAGYVTLALTSTLVQEVWLGGVSYVDSPRRVLVLAGVFTPWCAFAGGLVGALVAGRSRWLAAAILC